MNSFIFVHNQLHKCLFLPSFGGVFLNDSYNILSSLVQYTYISTSEPNSVHGGVLENLPHLHQPNLPDEHSFCPLVNKYAILNVRMLKYI